jgi:superfamily II DNA or RNA helicase
LFSERKFKKKMKKVKIEVSSPFCRIIADKESSAFKGLFRHLTFKRQPRKNRPIERKWFLQPVRQRFPLGLLPRVLEYYKTLNYDIQITRTFEEQEYYYVGLNDLSSGENEVLEEREIVEDVLKEVSLKKRGLLELATAFGKTELCLRILLGFSRPGLYLVSGNFRVQQTLDRFKKRFPEVEFGVACGGKLDLDAEIVVASPDALRTKNKEKRKKIKEYLKRVETLIVDEVHLCTTPKNYSLLMKIPASIRIGLSGTVLTGDLFRDMRAESAFGPLLFDVPLGFTMSKGYAARAKAIFFEFKPNRISDNIPYLDAYRRCLVEDKRYNQLIAHIVQRSKCGVLVLCGWIPHLENIQKELPPNFPARVVSDKNCSKEEIAQAVEDLREGRLKCILATKIFQAGLDVPNIRTVIMGDGKYKRTKILQELGRGVRRKEVDNSMVLVDFIHYGNRYLLDHALKRIIEYEKQGVEVETGCLDTY